jgi:hypothetical protein
VLNCEEKREISSSGEKNKRSKMALSAAPPSFPFREEEEEEEEKAFKEIPGYWIIILQC